MSRYLFVGDLHGKVDIMQGVLTATYGTDTMPVFMGDYVDSFTASIMEQLIVLDGVLDAVEDGRAIALMGNHELSYICPKNHRASGYSPIMDTHLISRHSRMTKLLSIYEFLDDWLVSHAGVSAIALNHYKCSLDEYLESSAIHDIGKTRGGHAPCGGIFWCDWEHEFTPIETQQVVGHSATDNGRIRHKNGLSLNFNVDCLGGTNHEYLLIKDGKPQILRHLTNLS